jgi:hypothetical protein
MVKDRHIIDASVMRLVHLLKTFKLMKPWKDGATVVRVCDYTDRVLKE